jgi:hypothetical protein
MSFPPKPKIPYDYNRGSRYSKTDWRPSGRANPLDAGGQSAKLGALAASPS